MLNDHESTPSELCRTYDLAGSRKVEGKREPAAHQQCALDALIRWYRTERVEAKGAILVLPTGGGKTFTAGHFTCRQPLSDGFKVLWLAHTHHLLEQALKSFDDLIKLVSEPKTRLTLRVVSGALGHYPIHSISPDDDVVIASLPACAKALSLRHPALEAFLAAAHGKLFVVFDEAHHSPAPTYRRLIEQLRSRCPQMVLLGLTATPTYSEENKRGWLKVLFPQGIVHQETAQKLMAARVLAKPVFEEARTEFQPDFSDEEYAKWIGTNRDVPEDLVTFLAENRARNEYIAGHYVAHRERFGKTLIFADRWAQCETICTLLKSRGVRADAVYSHVTVGGGTAADRNRRSRSDNAEILDRFRKGDLDVLVNVRMLTEGTDVPDVNTVFLTRQTTSQILLTQMIGRALRGPNFGGTEKAYIVSFIDDWKQRICWADYEQIGGGTADTGTVIGKRPPLHLIAIDLIRRLARQMDSGITINPGPYRSFLPLGWFRVQFDAQVEGKDEFEPVDRLILVYEHEKPGFDRFIESLRADDLQAFDDNSVEFDAVRAQLEEWEGRYFTEKEHRIGLSLVNDMFSIVRHMAQNDRQVPAFFAFESRSDHDLDAVALKFIADDLGPLKLDQSLRHEFGRTDRFWRTLYSKYEQFKSHYNGCVDRIIRAQVHGDDPDKPLPMFSTQERVPDREPTDELKEQVKSRDAYRCLCCGSTVKRWLQVDHVAPSYLGGSNHIDNLQTLCQQCNSGKGISRISFRSNGTTLTTAPHQSPTLPMPWGDKAKDAEEWKEWLRRWLNLFYQCAAVDTIDIGGKGERFYVWSARLFPGNDPVWVEPYLEELAREIRAVREIAGFTPAPERIVLNPPTQLPIRAADRDRTDEPVTTLESVLEDIWQVEKFRVEVYHSVGKRVRGNWSREMKPYPPASKFNGDDTVAHWKQTRFFKHYPIFNEGYYRVVVLDGSNQECTGNRTLRTVRNSYGD